MLEESGGSCVGVILTPLITATGLGVRREFTSVCAFPGRFTLNSLEAHDKRQGSPRDTSACARYCIYSHIPQSHSDRQPLGPRLDQVDRARCSVQHHDVMCRFIGKRGLSDFLFEQRNEQNDTRAENGRDAMEDGVIQCGQMRTYLGIIRTIHPRLDRIQDAFVMYHGKMGNPCAVCQSHYSISEHCPSSPSP